MRSHETLLEPVNGSRTRKTVIGKRIVCEPFERKVTYASACNYTLVEVPVGEYDIYLLGDRQGGTTWAMIGYQGVVTDDHYVNYIGAHSSLRPKQGIGETRRCAGQTYPYEIAKLFATDPDYVLAEDWSTGSEPREYSDGRPYTSYHLVRPDGSRCSI